MLGLKKLFTKDPLEKLVAKRKSLIDTYYILDDYTLELENQIYFYETERKSIIASKEQTRKEIDALEELFLKTNQPHDTRSLHGS